MGRYWDDVENCASLLAFCTTRFDDDGIDLSFIFSAKQTNTKGHKSISKLVQGNRPPEHHAEQTQLNRKANINAVLDQILRDYKRRIRPHAPPLRKLVLFVLTDGDWLPHSDAIAPIQDLAKTIENNGLPHDQVGVQFIRFGDSEHGSTRLSELDDSLSPDVVDVEAWTNGNVWKMLLGSINKDFDPAETAVHTTNEKPELNRAPHSPILNRPRDEKTRRSSVSTIASLSSVVSPSLGSSLPWSKQSQSTAPTDISQHTQSSGPDASHEEHSTYTFFNYQDAERSPPQDMDLQSVFSADEDIHSQADSDAGKLMHYRRIGMNYLTDIFAQHSELSSLYQSAARHLSQERFARNHRRLLKRLFLDLTKRSVLPLHKLALEILRSKRRRHQISSEIWHISNGSIDEIKRKMSLIGKAEKEFLTLNRWLQAPDDEHQSDVLDSAQFESKWSAELRHDCAV